MPAQAGIQGPQLLTDWIPAFAGMTGIWAENSPTAQIAYSTTISAAEERTWRSGMATLRHMWFHPF